MSLWIARHEAERSLEGRLRPQADLLALTFALTDECTIRLEASDSPFGKATALLLIKARNFALGCYSLALDALAQEAGALFRPLLEALEMLTYLRRDPSRVEEVLEGRLPKAGIVAGRIESRFKDLRNYLNTHASHLSLRPEAMLHLVDLGAGPSNLRLTQPFDEAVLRQNLHTLLATFVCIAGEAVSCLSVAQGSTDDDLIHRWEELRTKTLRLIRPGEHPND